MCRRKVLTVCQYAVKKNCVFALGFSEQKTSRQMRLTTLALKMKSQTHLNSWYRTLMPGFRSLTLQWATLTLLKNTLLRLWPQCHCTRPSSQWHCPQSSLWKCLGLHKFQWTKATLTSTAAVKIITFTLLIPLHFQEATIIQVRMTMDDTISMIQFIYCSSMVSWKIMYLYCTLPFKVWSQ